MWKPFPTNELKSFYLLRWLQYRTEYAHLLPRAPELSEKRDLSTYRRRDIKTPYTWLSTVHSVSSANRTNVRQLSSALFNVDCIDGNNTQGRGCQLSARAQARTYQTAAMFSRFSFGVSSKKTFKPVKGHQGGSKREELHQFTRKTLGR